MKNIIVEIHVFLATNGIYFTWKIESNICLVTSSCTLRDKLCLAAVAAMAPFQARSAPADIYTALFFLGIFRLSVKDVWDLFKL